MQIVMVGGHTRNIGKTSVIEGIIRGLPELSWTAVKITQYGHGVCSVHGEPCGCAVADHEYSISEETERDSGTDTSRFLAAGARRSVWMRTRQGDLHSGLNALRKAIETERFVIIESNSLRRFLEPAIYLQVLDPENADFKNSAQQFFDLADGYVIVTHQSREAGLNFATPLSAALLSRQLDRNRPHFAVTAQDRFISDSVIDFIRARLRTEETER